MLATARPPTRRSTSMGLFGRKAALGLAHRLTHGGAHRPAGTPLLPSPCEQPHRYRHSSVVRPGRLGRKEDCGGRTGGHTAGTAQGWAAPRGKREQVAGGWRRAGRRAVRRVAPYPCQLRLERPEARCRAGV